MPTILEKLRGFVQPIIRGYESIKAGIAHTVEVFRTYAPALEETVIADDYTAYEDATAIQELEVRPKGDQLLPWYLHGKSPVSLSAEYKYDVKAVYENVKGETVEAFWSIIDDQRLSESEIIDMAGSFPADYKVFDPKEFPFLGELEVIACWRRD